MPKRNNRQDIVIYTRTEVGRIEPDPDGFGDAIAMAFEVATRYVSDSFRADPTQPSITADFEVDGITHEATIRRND